MARRSRHQEESAYAPHLVVQFIESTKIALVVAFASLSLYVNAQIRLRESRSSVASRSDTLIIGSDGTTSVEEISDAFF